MMKNKSVLKLNDHTVYFCHICNDIAVSSFAGMLYCDKCFVAAIHGLHIRKSPRELETENYLLRRIVSYQDKIIRAGTK